MRYRQLGSFGPTVSVVGLGASHFGRVCNLEQTRAVVDAALDVGITFIDTAEAYAGSEELLGQVLRGRRQDVIVSSKFGHPWTHPRGRRGTRQVVRASIEGTLRRLQTDYLDVYLMHSDDPATPLEETLEALHELVQRGCIRFIGASNFPAWKIVDAHWIARTEQLSPFVCVQHPYNLLDREIERDIVPVCTRYGVGLVPAVPLASGLLSGRYRRGEPVPPGTRVAARQPALSRELFDRLEKLECFASARGISLLELAIGGLAAQPCVGPVITGATTPDQIRANARAADWAPSAEVVAELNSV
jgi:aryl-alcohol dehydrogenase-like predicted oxidoreductase